MLSATSPWRNTSGDGDFATSLGSQDHQVQLLALHSTIQTLWLRAVLQFSLSSISSGLCPLPWAACSMPTTLWERTFPCKQATVTLKQIWTVFFCVCVCVHIFCRWRTMHFCANLPVACELCSTCFDFKIWLCLSKLSQFIYSTKYFLGAQMLSDV